MKNKIIIGVLISLSALVLAITNGILEFGNTEISNQTVSADDGKENSVPIEKAQEKVDIDLVIPTAPEEFTEPFNRVIVPPKQAVSDPEAIRNMTKVESFYQSKDKNDKSSIRIVQTNHKIRQMDPKTGKEIIPVVKTIDGKEVYFTECDCEPPGKIYWWYDGEATTKIQAFGKINEEKIEAIIKKMLFKK